MYIDVCIFLVLASRRARHQKMKVPVPDAGGTAILVERATLAWPKKSCCACVQAARGSAGITKKQTRRKKEETGFSFSGEKGTQKMLLVSLYVIFLKGIRERYAHGSLHPLYHMLTCMKSDTINIMLSSQIRLLYL